MTISPCPYCGRPTEATLRGGGWTVDCTYNPFGFLLGTPEDKKFPCCALWGFPSYYKFYPTEEEAIEDWNNWANHPLTLMVIDAFREYVDKLLHNTQEGADNERDIQNDAPDKGVKEIAPEE